MLLNALILSLLNQPAKKLARSQIMGANPDHKSAKINADDSYEGPVSYGAYMEDIADLNLENRTDISPDWVRYARFRRHNDDLIMLKENGKKLELCNFFATEDREDGDMLDQLNIAPNELGINSSFACLSPQLISRLLPPGVDAHEMDLSGEESDQAAMIFPQLNGLTSLGQVYMVTGEARLFRGWDMIKLDSGSTSLIEKDILKTGNQSYVWIEYGENGYFLLGPQTCIQFDHLSQGIKAQPPTDPQDGLPILDKAKPSDLALYNGIFLHWTNPELGKSNMTEIKLHTPFGQGDFTGDAFAMQLSLSRGVSMYNLAGNSKFHVLRQLVPFIAEDPFTLIHAKNNFGMVEDAGVFIGGMNQFKTDFASLLDQLNVTGRINLSKLLIEACKKANYADEDIEF